MAVVVVQVVGVVATPDGQRAASIGADGCLRLWDVPAGGACLSEQPGHLKCCPLSLQLVCAGSAAFSSGGDRKLLRWDMITGSPTIILEPQQGSRAKHATVSADGRIAAMLLFDSSIGVYDAVGGGLRKQLMQRGERDPQRVHSGGVNCVVLSRDGSVAVSASKDATARVWDTESGECLWVLQVRMGGCVLGFFG